VAFKLSDVRENARVKNRGSAELAGRVLGGALLVVGAIATFNQFVFPEARIGGQLFGLLFFFGPLLLTVGILILVYCRSRKAPSGDLPLRPSLRSLLLVGVGLLAAPVLFLIGLTVTRDELYSMFFLISMILLGLPGMACLVFVAILWLIERRRAARTPSP
jgi:uncharacterized membrane protein